MFDPSYKYSRTHSFNHQSKLKREPPVAAEGTTLFFIADSFLDFAAL